MISTRRFANIILVSLVCALGSACANLGTTNTETTPHTDDMSPLEKKFYRATAQLFIKEDGDEKRFLCTTTAFEKQGRKTYFVGAAHCVAEDDAENERVNVSTDDFCVAFDDDLKKSPCFPVKILGAGYQHRGDDLLVLVANLDKEADIIPLADNDPEMGEAITNVACPGGYGKQLFRGSVSLKKLDQEFIIDDINWTNNVFIQTMVGPGSSGSSNVSLRQQAIVSITVGMMRSSPSVVTVPISRFKAFWAATKAGTYRWQNTTSTPVTDGGTTENDSGLSADKLVKQINDHYPDRPDMHLPMPGKTLPMKP